MITDLAIGEIDLWKGVDLVEDLGHYNILSTIMKHARENIHIGHKSNAWGIRNPSAWPSFLCMVKGCLNHIAVVLICTNSTPLCNPNGLQITPEDQTRAQKQPKLPPTQLHGFRWLQSHLSSLNLFLNTSPPIRLSQPLLGSMKYMFGALGNLIIVLIK